MRNDWMNWICEDRQKNKYDELYYWFIMRMIHRKREPELQKPDELS